MMTLPFSENCLRKLIAVIIFLFSFFPSIILKAQTTIVNDSVFIRGTTVVIPGKEYKRSGYHNFFWGSHNRREWISPVRVENFYIDTAVGGLIPIQESGSRQSRGLRLKNQQGKEYVLRSIDKDFGNGLPEIYHGTFISHIAKDQASIGYPFAAITITPMIQAAGIYHTNPRIIFVPEQGPLGDYNKKYGNQLYLFEERADENQEDAPHFGNSKNVIGTEKLYEHIYEDNDDHVDQKAFARARLFDMFIGDWGRHADQWRWASFKNDTTIYRPIPRDRDQAYTKIDGLYPSLTASIGRFKFLQGFRYDIKNVKKFNIPGQPLDRKFTNELTEQQWIDLAKELQQALTDQVIESSIHLLPPEIFSISGKTIIAKLKSRRDHLQLYAKAYYDFLSHHVDLAGSQKKELFEINRISPDETQINIYKIKKDDKAKDNPYYSRTFKTNETREVRIYSLESSDIFKITGNTNRGVKVRIIDPQGIDSLKLQRTTRTKLSIGKKFEFDTNHTKKFDFSVLPLMSPPEYKVFEEELMPLFTKTGARISVNLNYNSQPWRRMEYRHQHLISANYGFLRGALNIGYVGRFRHAIGPFDLLIKARFDGPAVENYFGTGNETLNTNSTRTYNRTLSTRSYGGLGLSRIMGLYQSVDLSVFYQSIKVKGTSGHFISINPTVDPSVFSNKQFGGAEAGYHFRKTNDDKFPTAGIDFKLGVGYIKNLKESGRSFTNFAPALSAYLPLGRSFSLASRVGGASLNGDADFYHLNKLGGYVNLRGYERERFSAKTIFYNNNELRWVTNTKNYLFNGKIGLLVFYDEGRVWQALEKSNKWHAGYGGGLILIPFNKVALTGTYCISEESKLLQLKIGMFF